MIDFNKKRYQVVGRYPLSPVYLNEIIEDGKLDFDMGLYPNLYRLLSWWEYRTPEEMPQYVEKITGDDGYHLRGDVLPVKWFYDPENNSANHEKCHWVAKVGPHYYNAAKLKPITKEDYDKAPKENKPSC